MGEWRGSTWRRREVVVLLEAGPLFCNCAGRRAAQPRRQAYMGSRVLAETAAGGGWTHLFRLFACKPGRGPGQRAGRCDAMRADGGVRAGAGEAAAAAAAAVPLGGCQVVRRGRISWIVLHQAERSQMQAASSGRSWCPRRVEGRYRDAGVRD